MIIGVTVSLTMKGIDLAFLNELANPWAIGCLKLSP
jgi:hypothetical protein